MHYDILKTFFTRSQEILIHQQILEDENFIVPVEVTKDFMIKLTKIPLLDFFIYLDQYVFPEKDKIKTSDISKCGSLIACTDELCQVLYEDGLKGKTVQEIGQHELYKKYLRSHHKSSWSRCGRNQAKTAYQLGLTFKNAKRWYLSCFGYGYVYPMLSKLQQKKFLARVLLRNSFYSRILSRVRFEPVDLLEMMQGLSPSTQGARSTSVVKLLQLCLDDMTREGIKWYDIRFPQYNTKYKKLTSRVLEGTWTQADSFGVYEDYFDGGVPLYTVKAACGYFVDHEIPEREGWMNLINAGIKTNSDDYFVVYAKGDSMLPKIKNGDLCLFKWYKGQNIVGEIVLTQCRDYDEEYESSYTIKRFHVNKECDGQTPTISLKPLNDTKYNPIIISADDGCDYKTIGVFVKVLDVSS